MINDTPHINEFIAKHGYVDMRFHTLRATFSSSSESNIRKLKNVLVKDNIHFTIKRGFFLRWQLVIDIPLINEFDEENYQNITGKLFSLASRCLVNLETIGLLG